MIISKRITADSCRLLVQSDNSVVMFWAGTEENDSCQTKVERQYNIINTVEVLGKNFIIGRKLQSVDIYNVDMCMAIIENVPIQPNAGFVFKDMCNEIFLIGKSTEGTKVYDDMGNILDMSDNTVSVDVIFSGTGQCIQKTAGKKATLYTLDGHLIG